MTTADLLTAGRQWQQAGDLPRAEAAYRQSLALAPTSAEAWCALGSVRFSQRKLDEAAACFQEALRLEVGSPDLHHNLGVVYSNLRRWEEAAACYRKAIALTPNRADSHRNLGSVLREAGQVEEGISALREALRLDPNYAEAWASLGLALVEADEPQAALESCRRASELNPHLVAAHHHQGVALFDLGRRQEALESYARSLAIESDLADAHKNRALLWLLEGKLAEGWAEYEWRWKCADAPPPPISQPLWDGWPLDGRTILLHAEQGLGDTIQFVRYASLVRLRGGRVIVWCQPELVSLVRRCEGVEQVVAQGDPLPPFDVHAPLMSLPRIFGTRLDTIPGGTPYVDVDPQLLAYWRDELAGDTLFKVGIAWQGSRLHRRDRSRSIPLACFRPLAALPGVRLYSLQKNSGQEQIAGVDFGRNLVDLSPRLGSFADTAAAVANLDLVISCDTSVAHLAGALGKPVWVAVAQVPDWRWLLDRDDSPWYPTLRLFRQTRRGDWGEVVERMAQKLLLTLQENQVTLPT